MLRARPGRLAVRGSQYHQERNFASCRSRDWSSSSSRRVPPDRPPFRETRMFDNPVTLAILVIVLLVILFLIANTLHIVRQYERLVFFPFRRVPNSAAGVGHLPIGPDDGPPRRPD